MTRLLDGQTVEVQGSAAKPYLLKNIGGVYSCSCPAWRNQSLPIDRRTCKHLRQVLGEEAESTRLGTLPAAKRKNVNLTRFLPPLLLAEKWDGIADPTGWLLSEKLDGVRAWWTGSAFFSRQGNRYFAPEFFTSGLPLEPLDGELWIGRKQFQKTVSVVRRQDQSEHWREVRFLVFDAPGHDGPFEQRMEFLKLVMDYHRPQFAKAHPHRRCLGLADLRGELGRIERLGGEGLMLRMPGSSYEHHRSPTLLKVKTFHDAEAKVIGHEPGSGRHRGRLGAVLVEMDDGTQFAVGSGFTDAERSSPPPIGSTITFRFQELTDAGVPRFPTFVRVCSNLAPTQGDLFMNNTRRFEFVEGSSDKFWEATVDGAQVTICYGRNGTSGQTETKSFSDTAAAESHAQKKIAEKLKKGYREVRQAA